MNMIDFLLLEAETDDVEDIDMEAEEKAIEEGENETEDNENNENPQNNTKQNNNEEESDGETDNSDLPDEEVETTDDNSEDDMNENDMDGEDDTEEVDAENKDQMSKAKRLFFYNNFESLYNTTLNFIDKLESIRERMNDSDKKGILLELESKLLKQKNDINFLLKKKIMVTSEENLNKLLLYFSTKTETIIDITKSLIKEAN